MRHKSGFDGACTTLLLEPNTDAMIYLIGILFGVFTDIMNQKLMYQYISELLDFAEKNYHVDKNGRGLASSSARDTGVSEDEIFAIRVSNATRLNALRAQIRLFSETYNFDHAMTEGFQRLVKLWERRGQSSVTESDY